MKKLSKTQREILASLDGMVISVPVEGTYHAAVRSLWHLGLITFRRTEVANYPQTPGGMVWHTWQHNSRRVVYVVSPTQAGKDFIYNGGIDQ